MPYGDINAGTGYTTDDPQEGIPNEDRLGPKKKSPLPGGGGGGGSDRQADKDQPASPGAPNYKGQPGPGLQGYEKPHPGTSKKLPWDDNPGVAGPVLAPLSGAATPWQRSGYHAVADPTKELD